MKIQEVTGYFGLTQEQRELFITTHASHVKAQWEENRHHFAPENIKEVKWDKKEKCLKVYYQKDWYH